MFDLEKLAANKNKAKNAVRNSEFFQFIHKDLVDRALQINNNFKQILLLQPAIEELLASPLKEKYPDCRIEIAHNLRASQLHHFDLIIFPFGMHWVPDVQNFLATIRQSLAKDGIFICNFPGGGTLQKLRYKLMELELETSKSHAPHLSPFIRFEQMTALLQQAGFLENIIDNEQIEIEASSALRLMQTLQKLGEANTIKDSVFYSINRKMYHELSKQDSPFIDYINLITFISSPTKGSIKMK